ncbi:tetratricopeptide repeat protein [Pseudoflavitalea sp. G-6-1-2]|uniref:tetratricopeptide repeat protein n=1 Tax=Pseudoflavitalea sp. G-6-1-2 TaxID=2728841 RepID=UPI00146A892A|nr:tetratricopeptide repeat protein [Pseudoflavitalea sp. G-6-1-2]NML21337.1 tetratricopeptide repeat protein [Pseudoflavitalea sp. G-6-1-2]
MRLLILLVVVMYGGDVQSQPDSTLTRLQRAVKLHDAGEYDAAISIYDEVIRLDSANLLAWYEKSFSLYASRKYLACAALCSAVLKRFSKGDELDNIYVNYGVSLDALKQTDDAIKIYNEGISKFPDNHLLYFNRAIAYDRQQMQMLAINDVQQALRIQPSHAASHLLLGTIMRNSNRIAAALSLSTYLLLEPNAGKTSMAYAAFCAAVGIPVNSNNYRLRNNVNVLRPDSALDIAFSKTLQAMQVLSAAEGALDSDSTNSIDIRVRRRIEILALIDTGDQHNFFLDFYCPFFSALQRAGYAETAAEIICAAGRDSTAQEWVAANAGQMQAFSRWLRNYKW